MPNTTIRSPVAIQRYKRRLSQGRLAAVTGVSRETIAKIESGRSPSLQTARAIAMALEEPIETLFPQTTATEGSDDQHSHV